MTTTRRITLDALTERALIVTYIRGIAEEEPPTALDGFFRLLSDKIEEGAHLRTAFNNWCQSNSVAPTDKAYSRWLDHF